MLTDGLLREWSTTRRDERAVAQAYRAIVEESLASLSGYNHAAAIELAALPEKLRGFGNLRKQATANMRAQASAIRATMLAQGH